LHRGLATLFGYWNAAWEVINKPVVHFLQAVDSLNITFIVSLLLAP